MDRIIKPMEEKYLRPSLKLVETVFAEWDSPEEGRMVRALVEEIRAKKYYLPALDLVMVDENDEVIGCAMFCAFTLKADMRMSCCSLRRLPSKRHCRDSISQKLSWNMVLRKQKRWAFG